MVGVILGNHYILIFLSKTPYIVPEGCKDFNGLCLDFAIGMVSLDTLCNLV